MRDAMALDHAGVACIYLEGIPREVAAMITAEIETPTIGIGAGPTRWASARVHDILNLTFGPAAKLCAPLWRCRREVTNAVQSFRQTCSRGNILRTQSRITCRKKRARLSKRCWNGNVECGAKKYS